MVSRLGWQRLCVFLAACIPVVSGLVVTITCDAPPVTEGQDAKVTCNFNRDVSELSSATVTVEHYKGVEPVTVLDCTPLSSGCKTPQPGYVLDGKVDTHLVLKIPDASKQNEGRYLCKMLSPDLQETDDVEPCLLTVDATTTPPTPTPTTERGNPEKGVSMGLIVGPVIGVVILVGIGVGVVICRRKKKLCFKGTDGRKSPLYSELSGNDKAALPTDEENAEPHWIQTEKAGEDDQPQDEDNDGDTAKHHPQTASEQKPKEPNRVADGYSDGVNKENKDDKNDSKEDKHGNKDKEEKDDEEDKDGEEETDSEGDKDGEEEKDSEEDKDGKEERYGEEDKNGKEDKDGREEKTGVETKSSVKQLSQLFE